MPTEWIKRTPGKHRDLYIKPEVVKFNHRQGRDLYEHLRWMETHTTVSHPRDFTDLQLDENGRTIAGGYRFTSTAFFQTAQIVAPGFSRFLPDISGNIVLPDGEDALIDGGMSTYVWNEMVEMRYSRFCQHQVIKNEDSKTIEGLIGGKHQYLENLSLYQMAGEALQTYKPDVQMYAAQLTGRRLALWYRDAKPMYRLTIEDEDWPFYSGYYFTNGEATGLAVRGTLAIFTKKGICLGPYKRRGGRVTHTGKDFFQRLGQMFTGVTSVEVPVAELREGAESLLTKSLGFEVSMNKQQRSNQTKKLLHALGHLGIAKNLAKEVIEAGLTAGRSLGRADYFPLQQVERLYASRTLIDLFVPLMAIARKLDLSRREKFEQAAYEMLTGRFLT